MEDALEKTLFKQVTKAIDVNHALLILMEKKLIDYKAIRNISIKEDFGILLRNPCNSFSDMYQILSVKYNCSARQIRRILKE